MFERRRRQIVPIALLLLGGAGFTVYRFLRVKPADDGAAGLGVRPAEFQSEESATDPAISAANGPLSFESLADERVIVERRLEVEEPRVIPTAEDRSHARMQVIVTNVYFDPLGMDQLLKETGAVRSDPAVAAALARAIEEQVEAESQLLASLKSLHPRGLSESSLSEVASDAPRRAAILRLHHDQLSQVRQRLETALRPKRVPP